MLNTKIISHHDLSLPLEVIYISCVCMVEILHDDDGLLLHIFSRICLWWCHVGSFKSAAVRVFTPQTSANAMNQLCFCPLRGGS